jgi:hypothetical protein
MNFWGKAERKRQQKSLLQPILLRPRKLAPRQCLEQYFGAWLNWQRVVAKERQEAPVGALERLKAAKGSKGQ